MTALRLAPPILALSVLAAHFLRSGGLAIPALIGVLIVLLLTVGRRWVARTAQGVLAAGTAVWIWTTIDLVQLRIAEERPYLRLVLILGGVALCTLLSALAFQTRALLARYKAGRKEDGEGEGSSKTVPTHR